MQKPDRPAGFTDLPHIGSHFIIQFRNAKEQPNLLMLHFPSLCLLGIAADGLESVATASALCVLANSTRSKAIL